MTDDSVLYERDGPIAIITINRAAKHNALDRETGEALARAFQEAERSDAACAVLTGAGDAAFTGGLDLNDPPDPALFIPGAGVVMETPLISAVGGWCVGAGISLVMASDLAVCAENASFLYPEGRIGFTGGIVASLVTRIAQKEAMRLMLLGETLPAEWALRVGLVNEVVPVGAQKQRALEWAHKIAGQAPLVIQTLKRHTAQALPSGPAEQAARVRSELRRIAESADAAEGKQAFFEKRPPTFTGS